MAISLSILIFLLLGKPQKTTLANKKEIFNEFTILFMGYFVLSFTGAEPDPEKRAKLGICLISISLTNITIHIAGLLIDTVKKVINSMRKIVKKLNCKNKRFKPRMELYIEPENKLDLDQLQIQNDSAIAEAAHQLENEPSSSVAESADESSKHEKNNIDSKLIIATDQ